MNRKTLNSNAIIQATGSRKRLIDGWGFRYAVWFLGLWLVAALVYWTISGISTGVETTRVGSATVRFSDCLYFSAVTITSLGYGDLRPIGAGRAMAGVEVVGGLIIVGLWVASVASRYAEVRLGAVHSELVDARFKDDRTNIDRLTTEFHTLVHHGEYQPSNTRLFSGGTTSREAVLDELFAAADGITRGLRYDVRERMFFDLVGPRPLGRLLGVVAQAIETLQSSMIFAMSSPAAAKMHDGNRQRLEQILERFEVIARCAIDHSPHTEHKESGQLVVSGIDGFYEAASEFPQ